MLKSIGTPSLSNSAGLVRAKHMGRALVTVAAVILLAGGGVIYLVNLQTAKAATELANKMAQAGSNKAISRRYNNTLESYQRANDQVKFLETGVTQQAYVPTLLQQLQTLAQSTHLQVVTVRPSAMTAAPAPAAAAAAPGAAPGPAPGAAATGPAAAPPYSLMPIQFDVTGTYPELMAFLYELPKFPKIVSVQSIALHPGGGAPAAPGVKLSNPTLSANIALKAYVFDDTGATLATTTADAPALGSFSSVRATQDAVQSDTTGSGSTSPASAAPASTVVAPGALRAVNGARAVVNTSHAAVGAMPQ